MYDNGYIVKCRSILTNDICLSEASHKADVFLVCISYLENIRVPAIRQLERLSCKPRTDGHLKVLVRGIRCCSGNLYQRPAGV